MRDFEGVATPSIIEFQPATQVVKFDEYKLQRYKARLNRDFDEFQKTRQFVLENMGYLKGRVIPMEVTAITNCPHYECVIVNDLLLYSYTELEQIIKDCQHANRKLGLDDDEPQPPKGA